MSLGEGLAVKLPPESAVEDSRSRFKAIREHLLIHTKNNGMDDESPHDHFRRQLSRTAPAFAFFAERLQDHCLLIDNCHTAIRREPVEISRNCMVFGSRPMKHTSEGLCFSVRVNEVTPRFEGFPLLGFTKL